VKILTVGWVHHWLRVDWREKGGGYNQEEKGGNAGGWGK